MCNAQMCNMSAQIDNNKCFIVAFYSFILLFVNNDHNNQQKSLELTGTLMSIYTLGLRTQFPVHQHTSTRHFSSSFQIIVAFMLSSRGIPFYQLFFYLVQRATTKFMQSYRKCFLMVLKMYF